MLSRTVRAEHALWSQEAWAAAEPVYQQILELDFIRELMSGTLPKETFLFYIGQDALYLAGFGRALAGIAARLDKPGHVAAYLSFAKDTVDVEKVLHQSFLEGAASSPSPTCLMYTSFMLSRLATAPVEVAMASTLPCFWVYKRVGDFILTHQNRDANPYRDWINTYGGEEYGNAVRLAISICDDMAETSPHRVAMTEAYVTATRLEWMFWHSAWMRESWPV